MSGNIHTVHRQPFSTSTGLWIVVNFEPLVT